MTALSRTRRLRPFAPLLLLALFAPLATALAAPAFTITTLNTAGGLPFGSSYAYGLNASGQAVGAGGNSTDGFVPFVYTAGVTTTLPADSYFDSANAISDNGKIVGFYGNVASRYDAGTETWSPLTPDDSGYDVFAVNDAGTAVGRTYDAGTSQAQAARFNADGTVTRLGTLSPDGTGGSCAHDINATGQMAGCADIDGGLRATAVRFDADGTIHDLGSLIGPGGTSEGSAINDLGQIAGSSVSADGELHGFIWTAGVFQDLGVVSGYASSEALALNNLGHAAGRLDGDNGPGAFYYDGSTMWDLSLLLPGSLADAGLSGFFDIVGLNDAGQILGNGFDLNNDRVGFLLTLTTVPEPATWGAILGLALGTLAVARHRRAGRESRR